MINKQAALRVVNPTIGVLFVGQALTGIFHALIPHEAYEIGHGYAGYLFAVMVLVHIWLNWAWVKSLFRKGAAGGPTVRADGRTLAPSSSREST